VNANELRNYLDNVSGYRTDDVREIFVSVNYARYGEVSSAIIEWQGSPPKTRTILYFVGSQPQVLRISQYTPKSLKKKIELGELVYQFLLDNNYVKTMNKLI